MLAYNWIKIFINWLAGFCIMEFANKLFTVRFAEHQSSDPLILHTMSTTTTTKSSRPLRASPHLDIVITKLFAWSQSPDRLMWRWYWHWHIFLIVWKIFLETESYCGESRNSVTRHPSTSIVLVILLQRAYVCLGMWPSVVVGKRKMTHSIYPNISIMDCVGPFAFSTQISESNFGLPSSTPSRHPGWLSDWFQGRINTISNAGIEVRAPRVVAA